MHLEKEYGYKKFWTDPGVNGIIKLVFKESHKTQDLA